VKLALAEADVALTQARLEDAQKRALELQAGPDPDQLAAAEARLSTAQTSLTAAKTALANTELRAPIDGTIADARIQEQSDHRLQALPLLGRWPWMV